ncbi:MAG: hypothetical protein QGI49_04215 [SAR202 cluster bacterium]|jgi:hypothetical protein|nr:hypothetical protein [SAR202 cluster bacterium]
MNPKEGLRLRSPTIELWPQGHPSETDGLTPEGRWGFLNEQVVWVSHNSLDDSRSAIRIPEGLGWHGRRRIAPSELAAGNHHYQEGQQWSLSEDGLQYRDCPISNAFGPSPGLVSARVELVDEEIVRIGIAVENDSGRPLENVTVHVCFNHRRSPMLGRRLFVQTASGWTDFRQYHQYFVTNSDSIRYDLRGERNPGALPRVTQPLLFSETVHEKADFVSVIGSRDATAIASNITWPCTDATLDFGDLLPRARTERDLYIGLGPGSRDAWLDRMARLL